MKNEVQYIINVVKIGFDFMRFSIRNSWSLQDTHTINSRIMKLFPKLRWNETGQIISIALFIFSLEMTMNFLQIFIFQKFTQPWIMYSSKRSLSLPHWIKIQLLILWQK